MGVHRADTIPTSLSEWIDFNQWVRSLFYPKLGQPEENAMWFVTIFGPVSAIFYIASAWQRIRTNGAWIARVDQHGYIYPHTQLVVSFWAVLYTLSNLCACVSFLYDLKRMLTARTIFFVLLTYPIMACFGWTKIWAMAYALPPSKYRLMGLKSKSITNVPVARYVSAIAFNIVILVGYVLPFAFGIPVTSALASRIIHSTSRFMDYQSTYSQLLSSQSEVDYTVRQFQALLNLRSLYDQSTSIKLIIRVLGIGFLVIYIVYLLALVWLCYRILSALRCQLKILRKALLRRELMTSSVAAPLSWNLKTENSYPKASSIKLCGSFWNRSSSSASSFTAGGKYRAWLLQSLRHQEVEREVWCSVPFKTTSAEFSKSEVDVLRQHCRKLALYTVSTFWQELLTCIVLISYTVLFAALATNAFQIPETTSFLKLAAIVLQWTSATWNFGIGMLLGIVSCLVAFSPPPELPQEPSECIQDTTVELPYHPAAVH